MILEEIIDALKPDVVFTYGHPRLRATWDDGSWLVIDLLEDHWYFRGLTLADEAQGQGFYTALTERLPDAARAEGIHAFRFGSVSPEGLRRLLSRGDWRQINAVEWEWTF